MLATEIHTSEIPNIFARFSDVVDARHWKNRVASVKADIRGNRFLHDFLVEENAIAFALARCTDLAAQYGRIPPHEIENPKLYSAIGFCTQVLSIADHSSAQQVHKLVRRIHGAFRNPDEMRAIQFELVAATHFAGRGHALVWPEIEGDGTFDLLIKDIGIDGLEVECKSVSRDKGRKVHCREVIELHHFVCRRIGSFISNLQSGLSVVVTIPNRLPTSTRERRDLAQRVAVQVLSGRSSTFDDGLDIQISKFDVALLGAFGSNGRPVITSAAIGQVTGTRNEEAVVIGSQSGGALVLVIQSVEDDALLHSIFKTLSHSANSQLTKKLPALFLIELHDLEPDALLNVAQQDFNHAEPPTALRVAVSNFLSGPARDHVVGVAFLSRSTLTRRSSALVASGGRAYFFPKRESRFWHEDFRGLCSSIR